MRSPVVCLAIFATACTAAQQQSFNKTVQQVVANHAAAITLVATPAVPLPDGGAGPSFPVANVFFGKRSPTDTTSPPVALPGAAVSIEDSAGVVASATDVGNGDYLATPDGGLRYDPGATYTFTIDYDGGSYVAGGTAPFPEHVSQLEPQFADGGGVAVPVFPTVAVGGGMTLDRDPNPDGGPLNIAFVTVNLITGSGASAQPTYTSVPQTPLALLELVAPGGDATYRAAQVTLPGSAFPQAGDYLVTLTAVQEGAPQSSNLFALSAILLGAGTAGIVQAK